HDEHADAPPLPSPRSGSSPIAASLAWWIASERSATLKGELLICTGDSRAGGGRRLVGQPRSGRPGGSAGTGCTWWGRGVVSGGPRPLRLLVFDDANPANARGLLRSGSRGRSGVDVGCIRRRSYIPAIEEHINSLTADR